MCQENYRTGLPYSATDTISGKRINLGNWVIESDHDGNLVFRYVQFVGDDGQVYLLRTPTSDTSDINTSS